MSRKQKIGFFIEPGKQEFPWLSLSDIAAYFKKKGFEIVGFSYQSAVLTKSEINVFDSFYRIQDATKAYDFNVAVNLSKRIKKEKLEDLVFANYQNTGLLVTAKYLIKGKLRLVYLQERPFSQINQDRFHSLRANQLDAWVTPNYQALQSVRGGANIEFGKLHVMGRPLRVLSKILRKKNNKSIRQKLGIDENAIAVGLFINQSTEPPRDFIQFLSTVASEPDLRSQIVFLISTNRDVIFKNKLKDKLLNCAMNLGLSESLFYFKSIKKLFADDGADILFLLTGEEPFSGASALARTIGVPCLGFSTGMLSEVLEDYPFQSLNELNDGAEITKEIELLRKMRHTGIAKRGTSISNKNRRDYLSNLMALIKALPSSVKRV